MTQPRALQVCPNDHPPSSICAVTTWQLTQAGVAVDTVFLGAPRGERWDGATYFGIERGAGRMTGALRKYVDGRKYRPSLRIATARTKSSRVRSGRLPARRS
jgi:hypothetical protein